MRHGRRILPPYVLTNFGCNYQIFELCVAEQKFSTERAGLTGKFNVCCLTASRSKLSCLIKLGVIRNKGFGNKSEYPAVLYCSGGIIYFSEMVQRQTDKYE